MPQEDVAFGDAARACGPDEWPRQHLAQCASQVARPGCGLHEREHEHGEHEMRESVAEPRGAERRTPGRGKPPELVREEQLQ